MKASKFWAHLYNDYLVLVLPFGWCIHLFKRGAGYGTFLVVCSDTGLFDGFDVKPFGFRIVGLRINHICRDTIIQMVDAKE